MKHLAIIAALVLATPAAAAPLCERLSTGAQVPCWNDAKIDAAMAILHRRGNRASRDFVISLEVNKGKFANASQLANYVLGELP